jgi:hypothetical protein
MIVLETDLGVPKDLDRVDLIVTRRGATLRSDQITLSPAKLLPTNIELRADREGGAPVTIQAVGRKDGRARIVREAVTTIPAARLATLHMPLNYLCDATAVEAQPGQVTSTCAAGLTCVQGVCAPSEVSEDSLPTFAPSAPNASTPGSGDTSCFDVTKCFEASNEYPLDLSDCSIETPPGAVPEKLTLALKEPLSAAGICDSAACWVVLDQDGWIPVGAGTKLGARISLPPGVCIARTQGKLFALAASTTCAAKTAERDLCSAWSPPKPVDSEVGHACTGPTDESCGSCGVRSRTCSNGDWSPWGPCIGAGPCAPRATDTCGTSGTRVCGDTCQWGACSTACSAGAPSDSRACGNCGTQTRSCVAGNWSDWSVCNQGECAPTANRSCTTGPGVQTCTDSCQWASCTIPACSGPPSQPCGTRCGTQARTCADGVWSDWSTTCIGEGECVPLTTQPCVSGGVRTCGVDCSWTACPNQVCAGASTQPCGNCGTQGRTCDAGTGTWSPWDQCSNEGVCSAGASQACSGGSIQTCDAATCQWNPCPVAVAVEPVCITPVAGGNPNTVTPYDCFDSVNYWDDGPTKSFLLNTATAGENIRFSTDGTDVDCVRICANDASCSQCASPSPDNGTCATGPVAPFTVVKAIGCKGGASASPQRQLTYADPAQVVTLSPPIPPTGTYLNDVSVTLTSNPPQPGPPAVPGANDVHICFVTGVAVPPDPTCSVVTGLCGVGSTEYDASAPPLINTTGTIFKAIACKAGVANASNVVSTLYTLQVSTPFFVPAGPNAAYGAPIAWVTTTVGTSFRWTRSGAAATASDPSCTSGNSGSSISSFDADCDFGANDCIPDEEFRVIACRPGYADSIVAAQTFHVQVAPYTLSPVAGAQPGAVNITFTNGATDSVGGATRICYSVDGTDIDTLCTPSASVLCSGPLSPGQVYAPAGLQNEAITLTVKSRACKDPPAVFAPTTQRSDVFTFAPYSRTEIIDGLDFFSAVENRMAVGNATQTALLANNFWYLSWDFTQIYVGYQGSALSATPGRYFHFYVQGGGPELTQIRDDLPGGVDDFGNAGGTWDPLIPGGVSWHFYCTTDTATCGARIFSGAAWVDTALPSGFSVAQNGTPGTSTAYIELRFPRVSLALTDSFLRMRGAVFDFATGGPARFPVSATGAQRYLVANMGAAFFPSYAGNLF